MCFTKLVKSVFFSVMFVYSQRNEIGSKSRHANHLVSLIRLEKETTTNELENVTICGHAK